MTKEQTTNDPCGLDGCKGKLVEVRSKEWRGLVTYRCSLCRARYNQFFIRILDGVFR